MHLRNEEQQTKATLYTAFAALTALSCLAACSGEPAADSRPITPSFESNKSSAPIGSPLEVTYRFEVGADSEPIAKDYRVFVHFLDSHDALLFTDDHTPPQATSSWNAGSTVAYDRTIFVPLYPYLGTARVEVGLYDPETGERLAMLGTENGKLGYQVGQLNLLDQKENIFLVYKEGWHELESSPENPDLEWQWTKGEAVCSFRNPKKDSLLYLQADSNVEAFENPLEVSVHIGDTELESFTVESRDIYLKKISIPASALGEEDWVDLRIVSGETFVPADQGIGADSRELGLRVYHLYVDTHPGT